MYLLFLDESGSPHEDLFVVGGVAVRAADWKLMRERWTTGLGHHWSLHHEPKWTDVRQRPERAEKMFRAIAGTPGVTCFAAVLRPRLGFRTEPRMFKTPEATYATALMLLAERFQRFLSRVDSYGLIIIDQRAPKLDDRLRVFFERLRRTGTPYVDLDRIVDSLFLGPSHYSVGLMAADLVVGCTRGAELGQKEAQRWLEILDPCFDRHPQRGGVEGVGLVRVPAVRGREPRDDTKLFEP